MDSATSEIPALPRLNFPPVRLRARRRGETVEIWDALRGTYLVLTPEEWVRQHLIAYLVASCGVQARRIVQEYAVALNGQPQRADVVVVGDRAEPLLLAECKAPGGLSEPGGGIAAFFCFTFYIILCFSVAAVCGGFAEPCCRCLFSLRLPGNDAAGGAAAVRDS